MHYQKIDNLFSSSLPGPGLVEVAQDDPDVLLLVLESFQLSGQLVVKTLREHNLELSGTKLPDKIVVSLELFNLFRERR